MMRVGEAVRTIGAQVLELLGRDAVAFRMDDGRRLEVSLPDMYRGRVNPGDSVLAIVDEDGDVLRWYLLAL